MDKVFWMDMQAASGSSLETKFLRMLKKTDLSIIIAKGALAAIKVHVGEKGNLAYINSNYARLTAELIKDLGGRPFLTDTNTLYSGGRHNAFDHFHTAAIHGYGSGTTGFPFFIADGLRGLDYEDVPFPRGKHIKSARLASALCQADFMVVLSHFKGHCETGFGGTIKNLGMGCAAIPGKLEQHSSTRPVFRSEKCVWCGQCNRRCPAGAISLQEKKAVVDYTVCIGCGQCVAACNYGAMNVAWDQSSELLIEKISEYAAAMFDRIGSKSLFINFATQISPDCDCWDYNDVPIVQDVGVFVSHNPLALDRATLDLVKQSPKNCGSRLAYEAKPGKNMFDAIRPGARSEHVFTYCRLLGMNDEYQLEKLG